MGLSNAMDVFETFIHEVLQGLKGCMNIADDVLVYGSTYEDFKTNVLAFLDHCVQEDMHLNPDKVTLDCPEVLSPEMSCLKMVSVQTPGKLN